MVIRTMEIMIMLVNHVKGNDDDDDDDDGDDDDDDDGRQREI